MISGPTTNHRRRAFERAQAEAERDKRVAVAQLRMRLQLEESGAPMDSDGLRFLAIIARQVEELVEGLA